MTKTTKDSIDSIIETINKKFGEGSIMQYGVEPIKNVDVISTGCPSLNEALGIGGFPRGKIVEIAGPEASGKSTLAMHLIAECQKVGEKAAYLDLEHSLDPVYSSKIGVNMEDLLISQPDSAESALEIVELLVRSEQVSLVIIDSVAALSTKAELDWEMGDTSVAGVARLLSKACRKLVNPIAKNNCLVVFINQMRSNIGGYGNAPSETTTGGKALKYYSSVRLDIRRIGAIKVGEKIIGNETRVKVAKNRFAPPLRQVEFAVIYGEGISKESDLIKAAIEKGVVGKSGAWLSFEGANFAQGIEKARIHLKDNPDFYDKIEAALKAS